MSAPDPVVLLLGEIPEEIEKAAVLIAAQRFPVRELNPLITDIRRQAAEWRRQASDHYALADILADEVRRRAEVLESNQTQ